MSDTLQRIDILEKLFEEVSAEQQKKFCWNKCFNKIPAEWLSLLEKIKKNPEEFERVWQSFVSKCQKDETYYRWLVSLHINIEERVKKYSLCSMLLVAITFTAPFFTGGLLISALTFGHPALWVFFALSAVVTITAVVSTLTVLALLFYSEYMKPNIAICETTKDVNDLSLEKVEKAGVATKQGVLTNLFAFFQSTKKEKMLKEIPVNRTEENIFNQEYGIQGYGTL